MVERKLFKTKLCVLYQRGRCPRQNCSFAHGNAELRRFTSSYNGKRAFRGGDLRDKLDKRHSPQRRYSPVRGARGRHTFRGSSPSRSLERNSDRKRRKKQLDVESDFSGSLKISDREEDHAKERKSISTENHEQLKEMLSNVDILDRRKSELQILVERKVEEADSLAFRINELEAQLSKVKGESKRITSKIKKFVKTYKQYVRAQDDLKRSHARFQKLGDRFTSGTGNGEDSSINIVSDLETNHEISPGNEFQHTSRRSKKVYARSDGANESMPVNLIDHGGSRAVTNVVGKFPHLNGHLPQSNISKEVEAVDDKNGGRFYVGNESKRKRGRGFSSSMHTADKLKGSSSGLLLPSTSMAAQAIDEPVGVEGEESIDAVEPVSTANNKASATHGHSRLPFPLPPPPPTPRNSHAQHKSGDENVNVEVLEEAVDVDIV